MEHSHAKWFINDNAVSYDVHLEIFFFQEMDSKVSSAKMLGILLGPQCVNTLRPRQNGSQFADNIFKCISLNEKFEF